MIALIKGIFLHYDGSNVVVENNGIGYSIMVSSPTLTKMGKQGNQVVLFTEMIVREDGIYLFGFHNKEEKNIFQKLISVSGIGAKVAMQILSGLEMSILVSSIMCGDAKTLSGIKGVGKKTAERIILELKEKFTSEAFQIAEPFEQISDYNSMDKDMTDAIACLKNLGISHQEAVTSVRKAKAESKNIEELISKSLKSLGR